MNKMHSKVQMQNGVLEWGQAPESPSQSILGNLAGCLGLLKIPRKAGQNIIPYFWGDRLQWLKKR